MRRSVFCARPAHAVYRVFGNRQPRRTFATLSTKDDSPPSPIEPSKEQAHPIGPFYESILRTPQPIPKEKPEIPPVTSQNSPAAEAPKPAAEPSKPAPEETPAKASADTATPTTAEEKAKPAARRTRKAKQPAADDTTTKSVPFSSTTTTSSSSYPSPPPQSAPGPALFPQASQAEQTDEPSSNSDVQARARVVFGSRLAGPAERAERLERIRRESRLIAGVLVPPKPEEPDNCCMSGCVNCVWDRFRDEMEDWADKSAEVERRLRARAAAESKEGEEGTGVLEVTGESMAAADDAGRRQGEGLGFHQEAEDRGAVSMDDDGGGSVGNWVPLDSPTAPAAGKRISKDFWDEELYKNLPVGIREFMKQEKRLKEKHMREGSLGG